MNRVILAPMEGLADNVLREVLTSTLAYDWCVTEFVRVTSGLMSHSAYTRFSPELLNGSKTRSGTPVRIQLLGCDPVMMGVNAAHLAKLKPFGIDLNFGCPAPMVNRHGGGAMLLNEPDRLYKIVRAVRDAVPNDVLVTAKMRLGVNDHYRALECALALEAGGAGEIVIHARTKADSYRPPARWELLPHIVEALRVPVIANGEVWTLADYLAIRAETGCSDVMLGRGAVSDPFLASRIRRYLSDGQQCQDLAGDWAQIVLMIGHFWGMVQRKVNDRQSPGRLKQWLGMMRRNYPQAETVFNQVRALRTGQEISSVLALHGVTVPSLCVEVA